MAEHHHRGRCIEADCGERFVRPVRHDPDIAEALLRGEGSARIDDHHVVAKRARHRRQRLRHMHGANDDEARGGSEHVDEHFTIAPRHGDASILCGKPRLSAGAKSWPRSSGPCASERAPVARSVTSAALRRAAMSPARRCSRPASSRPASLQRLDEDADGAAASEPGLPGDFILDAELQHLGLARGQHLRGFGDHFTLDAAARDRA